MRLRNPARPNLKPPTTPISPPSGPAQERVQRSPAKSKFLAALAAAVVVVALMVILRHLADHSTKRKAGVSAGLPGNLYRGGSSNDGGVRGSRGRAAPVAQQSAPEPRSAESQSRLRRREALSPVGVMLLRSLRPSSPLGLGSLSMLKSRRGAGKVATPAMPHGKGSRTERGHTERGQVIILVQIPERFGRWARLGTCPTMVNPTLLPALQAFVHFDRPDPRAAPAFAGLPRALFSWPFRAACARLVQKDRLVSEKPQSLRSFLGPIWLQASRTRRGRPGQPFPGCAE